MASRRHRRMSIGKKRDPSYLRAIGVSGLGFVVLLMALEAAGVRINLANSMPAGVYRLAPCGEEAAVGLGPGDLVAVDTRAAARLNPEVRFFEERRYLSFTGSPHDLLLKQVAAVGDGVVEEQAGILVVDGQRLTSAASTRSAAVGGEALPEVSFPYRLRRGEIWLSSEHRRGIDSRYFGGVAQSAVACRAEALWTR